MLAVLTFHLLIKYQIDRLLQRTNYLNYLHRIQLKKDNFDAYLNHFIYVEAF